MAFEAPSLHAPPAQFVGEAKAPATQPGPLDQSATVPDLPTALVTQLNDAKADPTLREAAIDSLFNHLKTIGTVENPPAVDGPPIEINVIYKNSSSGSRLAYTQYVSTGRSTEVAVHVYAPIFTKSVAAIYSTLRHELIHAAQQTQSADADTDRTDEYIFGLANNDPYLTQKLIWPLQEIETHVWELVHAAETGINTDGPYVNETDQFLTSYTNAAIAFISGARTSAATIAPFSGYIHKAADLLRSVPKDALANALLKAYNDNQAKKPSTVSRTRKKKGGGKKTSAKSLALKPRGTGIKKKSVAKSKAGRKKTGTAKTGKKKSSTTP